MTWVAALGLDQGQLAWKRKPCRQVLAKEWGLTTWHGGGMTQTVGQSKDPADPETLVQALSGPGTRLPCSKKHTRVREGTPASPLHALGRLASQGALVEALPSGHHLQRGSKHPPPALIPRTPEWRQFPLTEGSPRPWTTKPLTRASLRGGESGALPRGDPGLSHPKPSSLCLTTRRLSAGSGGGHGALSRSTQSHTPPPPPPQLGAERVVGATTLAGTAATAAERDRPLGLP